MIMGWGMDTVLPIGTPKGVAFAAVITLVSEITMAPSAIFAASS